MRDKNILSGDTQNEIVEIGNKIATHLLEDNIKNIMFLDCSARLGCLALKGALKHNFHQEERPNIYFTNPEGYKIERRGKTEIIDEFNTKYKTLISNKDKGLMVFDMCMHSGESMRRVTNTLREVGFGNLHIGLAQPSHGYHYADQDPSFVALNHQGAECYCHFPTHIPIKKNPRSILSSRVDNETCQEKYREIRKEISDLFKK